MKPQENSPESQAILLINRHLAELALLGVGGILMGDATRKSFDCHAQTIAGQINPSVCKEIPQDEFLSAVCIGLAMLSFVIRYALLRKKAKKLPAIDLTTNYLIYPNPYK